MTNTYSYICNLRSTLQPMKHIIPLILFLLISIAGAAQSHRFADSTAQWYMGRTDNAIFCNGCYSYSTEHFTITGDTIVNSRTYQKLGTISTPVLLRDSAHRVYRYYDDREVIVYDFNYAAGDTFSLGNLFGNASMNVFCNVDSVDTVHLLYPRKRMFLTYNNQSFFQDIWIEGIGSLHSNFLSPGLEQMAFDMPSYHTHCFYEDDSLLVHADSVNLACDFDTFAPPPHRFFKEPSEWYTMYTEWCMTAPCIYFTTYSQHTAGDTMINGMFYQKVRNVESSSALMNSHVRKDTNGKVYMINEQQNCEVMIYDFGAEVGDTVEINYNCGQQSIFCFVDSTATLFMGGAKKAVYVRYWSSGAGWCGTDTWIDGIGSLRGPQTYPAFECRFTDGGAFDLRCFFAEDTLVYHKYQYSDMCDFDSSWVSISDIEIIHATLFPNPITNIFSINLTAQPQPNTAILIYNAIGALVKQDELTTSTQQIDVAELPKGMYTYAITQQGVRQASGKLIISH